MNKKECGMNSLPWGVITILGTGLLFTSWCIYYILRLAYLEMKDEEQHSNHSINNKHSH
jgi:hypothetical protein